MKGWEIGGEPVLEAEEHDLMRFDTERDNQFQEGPRPTEEVARG